MHDRRLLRSLGFLTATGAEVPVDDEPTDEDVADEGADAELDDLAGTASAGG